MNQNFVVVFSHGMGVRKDNLGLFTDIARLLSTHGVESVQFDYNTIDDEKNEVFVPPFSQQAEKLQSVLAETAQRYPAKDIVIIAQSQGCIIPTLCTLSFVRQVIGIAPFFHTNMAEVVKRFESKPENKLDLTSVSRRHRSDGSTTLFPPEYWQERFKMDIVERYNSLAQQVQLSLIYGHDDKIIDFNNLREIKYARIINADGNHDFSEQYRAGLLKIVAQELQFQP